MNNKTEFHVGTIDRDFELQIRSYYSSFKCASSFKQNLKDKLHDEISKNPAGKQKGFPLTLRYANPKVRWALGIVVFTILCILSLTIAPVRKALGKTIDLGYIKGVGFVRMSETYVLNGKIISDDQSQAIVIDQVVMDSDSTTIWLHTTGESLLETSGNGPIAYIETSGQQYDTSSWGWVDDNQSGVFRFSASQPGMPLSFLLHIGPDRIIPIQLIPMRESTDHQAVTLFSEKCQTHHGIELCVNAFITDSDGYHLLLNAISSNPGFYLESLYLSNSSTGEDVQLMDSSGNLLQRSSLSSADFSLPFEIPVEVFDAQREASTTLHFSPASKDNDTLTLTVPGLQVKTPIDQIINCNVGDNPVIGSSIPCETSISIGGIELNFHSIEVSQGQTGTQLRMISDPIQPKDNLMVTGAYLENLNTGNYFIGTSFEVKTHQLILFLEQDSFSSDPSFNIRIVDGYLTILEPYQFNWTINP